MLDDVKSWLELLGAVDPLLLGVLAVLAFRILAALNAIKQAIAVDQFKISSLEKWRDDHEGNDREEHQRLHDRITARGR